MGENLKSLFSVLEVMPISSAECERGFSQMNLYHSAARNRLLVNSVSDLLMIGIKRSPLCHWNAQKYVVSWLEVGYTVWPDAEVLLCTFNVLQACWRWLWNARNDIAKHDRPELLNVLHGLLNATTETECLERYAAFQSSNLKNAYPQFADYLYALWDRCKEWRIASLFRYVE